MTRRGLQGGGDRVKGPAQAWVVAALCCCLLLPACGARATNADGWGDVQEVPTSPSLPAATTAPPPATRPPAPTVPPPAPMESQRPSPSPTGYAGIALPTGTQGTPALATAAPRMDAVAFEAGRNYPVYSGPGEQYVRPNQGKASVSTNGWIAVLGVSGNWVLIEYELNQSGWRRGYIAAAALPPGVSPPQVVAAGRATSAKADCLLTDDPSVSRRTLATVRRGEALTLLHGEGRWAYVEVQLPDGLYRGYVPWEDVEGP